MCMCVVCVCVWGGGGAEGLLYKLSCEDVLLALRKLLPYIPNQSLVEL